MPVSRRELLALFSVAGTGLVLAACGGSTKSPVTAVTSGSPTTSGPVTQPGSAASSVTSSAAAPVAHIGGAHVAASQAVTTADVARVAAEANGSWRGGWHDTAGGSGNSDVAITINPSGRTARADLSFSGPLLGSTMPTQTYEIDLLSFALTADSYQVSSPQFGKVTIEPGGATSATATATAIPGHADIQQLQVSASRLGQRVDLTYSVHYTNGKVVQGTMAFGTGGDRAVPAALPTAGGAPSPAGIASGGYAAGLITADQVSTIMGAAFKAPTANGGRLFYANGIDVSNALCSGKNESVQYSVYLAHRAADMKAFWQTELGPGPKYHGPWKAAYWLAGVRTLYVYSTDTSGLTVNITPNVGAPSPTAARLRQWPTLSRQLAADLTRAIGTS